jgi:hypothetical protein
MPTFAFKAIAGAMSDPDVGPFPFQGQEGVKQVTITNTTERGVLDTAADGTIMVSYVSGASGGINIETQQDSSFHQYLISWANVKFANAETGNAANFAAAAIKIVDLLSGSIHTLTGVFPTKIPDKPYGPQGGFVTWRLLAANNATQ